MHNEELGNRNITPNMWIFIKLAALTFCTLLFKLYGGGQENLILKNDTIQDGLKISIENISVENLTRVDEEIVEKVVVRQPSCPKSYVLVILEEICVDIVLRKSSCTPEDLYNLRKHKIPASYYTSKSRSSNDNQGNAVNYIVGGLIVTSLSAALVELYKAKFQHPKDGDKKTKTSLSIKCSLADLTVLKHHRKELVRRESVLELPEEGGGGSKQALQGFRPPPLNRRCSFPVGPNLTMNSFPVSNSSRNSSTITSNICGEERRTSIDHLNMRRPSVLDGPRTSIIDGRRPSVVMEGRRTSFIVDSSCRSGLMGDNRRFSVNEEYLPEKRHHTRLVHRH